MCLKRLSTQVLTVSLIALPLAAYADEPIAIGLTLRNHKFEPAEIKAPAGKTIAITLKNEDESPEEFDSTALRIEKIVTSGGTVTIKLRPLAAGRYEFRGEYHEATAKGVLVVE
jgi:plastocyanin